MEKVKSSKKFVCEILCFVFGIVLSLVGLYFYHQQYLCYEYTPLLFILGVVVCLGGSLLSLSLSITKNETKNAKIKKLLITAVAIAISLLGLMFLLNLAIGKGELTDIGLFVPVYITFAVTAFLVVVCILKSYALCYSAYRVCNW